MVRPILKWAGGKKQILSHLVRRMPKKFGRYFEPFIGGGALFFHLQPQNACICDINPDLINVYLIVRDRVEELIEDAESHENSEEYYYKIRDLDREPAYRDLSAVKKASRFLYLNKTCFNGLYRMNSRGEFNVPFGFYKNPKIVDEENLRNVSDLLKKIEIRNCSFLDIEESVGAGDFVYLDPPYAPVNKTSSFTKYFKDDFDANMQIELKNFCDRLDEKGVLWMVSNSFTPLIRDLYQGYNVKKVPAIRAINCKGERRGKIFEVIVTNYRGKK